MAENSTYSPKPPPFNPLPVEPTFFAWRGHQIATYRSGNGKPILLVHSINAAASAYEMRHQFSELSDQFQVHALDLLGYGRSDRPNREYSAEDYIDVIGQYIQHIGEPLAIIASSLASAYAIEVAAQWPSHVRSLVLICPVGISQLAKPAGPKAKSIYRILRGPVGKALFRAISTRWSIRYFLTQDSYARPETATAEDIEMFYVSSHQPGAHYAPFCFVTGLLNCSIGDTFAQLEQPILIIWGREAKITPVYKAHEFLKRNPFARLAELDNCSGLAQAECPEAFNALARNFLT